MTGMLVVIFLVAGATFMLLAAVGVLRMPDLYMRMQATTKATTLGAGCLLVAAALALDNPGAWVRALAVVLFLYLTAPVAAHVIARAAYFVGTNMWKGTVLDEMKGCYDEQTHELRGEKFESGSMGSPGAGDASPTM